MSEENTEKLPNAPGVHRRKKATTAPAGVSETAVEAEAEPSLPAAPAPPDEPAPARKLASAPVIPDEDVAPEPSFRELLDGVGRIQEITQGTMISGSVVAFSGQWIFVDLGGKTEGILAADELHDKEGKLTVGIGDTIEAFVVSMRGGEIRLSNTMGRQIRDFESLMDAYDAKLPVEARVVGTNKGGYEVMVGGRRAFCPLSQMDIAFTDDPEVHVNRVYRFRIMQLGGEGKKSRIVLSRAAVLREERERRREELRDELEIGNVYEGVVRSVRDFGAFVDLGGIDGLVHVSQLSWSRVEHPSEVVKEGDTVTVKVLDIKRGEKGDRISLSMREAGPHPWVAVGTKFVEGETYPGTVTRLEPYGAFVELEPGLEGLIHVSELSWERRINHPKEVLTEGDRIQVYLKDVDHEKRRLALSLKALAGDPWAEVAENHPVGSQVEGVIEKIEAFGIFLEVAPGVVALIPGSETGSGGDLRRNFKPGQKLTATVLSIERGRRRMSLSLRSADEERDVKATRKFLEKQAEAAKGGGSFGTLGDLFKKKLE